jgi:hypothetical protein
MSLLNRLNNLRFTDDTIEAVKFFKINGYFQEGLSPQKQYNLKKKYQHFIVKDNKLIYKYGGEYLIVVPTNEKEALLQKIYGDITQGLGKGFQKTYEMITDKYLNIKRQDIKDFLMKQPVFQLSRHPVKNHTVNKPYLPTKPYQVFAIDLVDMDMYKGYNYRNRYLFTCIDHFSRFAFAYPIRNKTPEDVLRAFKKVIDYNNGVMPSSILSDNGLEFKGKFDKFLKDNNIIHRLTKSYSPTSNPICERFNQTLRKLIYHNFIRTQSLNYTRDLQKLVDNYNTSIHSTTKFEPVVLFVSSNDSDLQEAEEIRQHGEMNLRKNAQRTLNKEKNEFSVGDFVRVDTAALYSEIRAKKKQGNTKEIIVKYSPEVFKIRSLIKRDSNNPDLENRRYTLSHLDNRPLLTQLKYNNPNKERGILRLFGSQLLRVDKPYDKYMTDSKLFQLNNFSEYKKKNVSIPTRLVVKRKKTNKKATEGGQDIDKAQKNTNENTNKKKRLPLALKNIQNYLNAPE